MASSKLKAEVTSLISKITKISIGRNDTKRNGVNVSFIEGIDVDSLMALEIVAALEKKYKIEISEEGLSKLGTIDDIVSLLEKLIIEKKPQQKTGKNIAPKSKVKEIHKQKSHHK